MDFFRSELLKAGLVSPTDLSLFEFVQSVDEGVDRINRFYRRYHSFRYINDRFVIRMHSPLPDGTCAQLEETFRDILVEGGRIYQSNEPFPEEGDEPEAAYLDRLVVNFNRQDFGRLRQLIDEINK